MSRFTHCTDSELLILIAESTLFHAEKQYPHTSQTEQCDQLSQCSAAKLHGKTNPGIAPIDKDKSTEFQKLYDLSKQIEKLKNWSNSIELKTQICLS